MPNSNDKCFEDPDYFYLMKTRRSLITSFIYLGDDYDNIIQRVIWKQLGATNQLVMKIANDANDYPPNLQYEPALLSTIVTITSDKCQLTPCNYWKGPTTTTKKFEDLKLSFQGECPTYEFLSKDFESLVTNSMLLMKDIADGNAKSTGFITQLESKKGNYAIQFNHEIFEVHLP
jgi:hypothetical protein